MAKAKYENGTFLRLRKPLVESSGVDVGDKILVSVGSNIIGDTNSFEDNSACAFLTPRKRSDHITNVTGKIVYNKDNKGPFKHFKDFFWVNNEDVERI